MTREEIIERLLSCLRYDPTTGEIRWVITQGRGFAGELAGCLDSTGYLVVTVDGITHYGHRLAWLLHTGSWPGEEIDHINGSRSDNRWDNLRDVPCGENQKNMKMGRNNTSGCTGVHYSSKTGKWVATIGLHGRLTYLGAFDERRNAVSLRKAAEKRFGYHENHGRAV